jgi:asparagine synthase (glutamine-hydrolysing)
MANALKPYGPDRQKIVVYGSAAFVFCLHKLTPEDSFEHQPLLFADRFVLLFDGRIDNRSELGKVLNISTTELNSIPDSTIASRLFDRWGARAFERIVGVFAIITMDFRNKSLICARDHMGLRVLHYHQSPRRFAIATAPEALFALSWVPRLLNRDKVGDTLVQRGLNGETTYYRDIYRVLPGSTVQVRGATFSKTRFWNPENIPDIRFKSDGDYVEAFQDRLEAAVRACLRSVRLPCASLTGGLDSSSIAVIAGDILATDANRLNTFTAVPEPGFAREELRGCYYDETPYVRQIAEANSNIVPNFVAASKTTPILQQIAQQIRLGGFTGGILNGLWVMDLLAKARAAGHNVMLGGEMGNITMSYHGRGLITELLLTGRWLRLCTEMKYSGYQWRRYVRQYILGPLIPRPIFRSYKQWRRGSSPPWCDFSAIHPEFAQKSRVVERAAREYMPFDAPPLRDCKFSLINDFHCYCETADWFGAARAGFGIDIRTPAFDRRIVEFCIGIPQEQFLNRGRSRWLIRRAMKGRLPESVLNKTKTGVQAADWYPRLTRERNSIMEELKRFAANAAVASIVDLQRLRGLVENWPDHEPAEYSLEKKQLLALPEALGAAYFIESVTRTNYAS